MSVCLMVAATALHLAGGEFELSWQHSVEKTGWRETWTIQGDQMVLRQAAIKGSGAGMDPGAGAVLRGGWWVWTPEPLSLSELVLAASGATAGGWRLCGDGMCQELGVEPGDPIRVSVCPSD